MLSDPEVTIKRPGESWGGIHYPKGRWRHNPTGKHRPLTDKEIQRLADRDKRTEEYAGTFREWLEKGNLFEDWQLAHAAQTIYTWAQPECDKDYDPAQDPAQDPDAGWPHLSASYSPALQSLTPLDVAWDRVTPLDEAEDGALAAWSDYRKLITGYYKALRGSQRARKDPDSDRHMRWLVRRQILGDSDKDITETDSSDGRGGWALAVKTVTDGIKKAEALVGPFRSEQPRLEVWHDDPDDIHYVE